MVGGFLCLSDCTLLLMLQLLHICSTLLCYWLSPFSFNYCFNLLKPSLSKTTSLPQIRSGKVRVHSTLPVSTLWDFTWFVIISLSCNLLTTITINTKKCSNMLLKTTYIFKSFLIPEKFILF